MIEAFWSRIHVELLDRRHWSTRMELANAIFADLEIFHHRQRLHSSLGMLTPDRVRESIHRGMRIQQRVPRNSGRP